MNEASHYESTLDPNKLKQFSDSYVTLHQDVAFRDRGKFLNDFPKDRLSNLELNDYVIGRKTSTFCYYVEVGTRSWASIQGSTAFKFGVYFGKTKSDPQLIYRFTHKYGKTVDSAFIKVKTALLDLVDQGNKQDLDFPAIDDNPLSQLFKAKILSLYYPDRFINVCSAEHLELLSYKLGFPGDRKTSEYQHLLLQGKLNHPTTRDWSNPKFIEFLYKAYIDPVPVEKKLVQKPRTKSHRKVNFEELQDQWRKIGEKAEIFAKSWEEERLRGAGLENFIAKIEDRRSCPDNGYDFISHNSASERRFIEVKSVAKILKDDCYRFFLSTNEHCVSQSVKYSPTYFFYLVFFDGNSQPVKLSPVLAKDLYAEAEMITASYVVRFNFEDIC